MFYYGVGSVYQLREQHQRVLPSDPDITVDYIKRTFGLKDFQIEVRDIYNLGLKDILISAFSNNPNLITIAVAEYQDNKDAIIAYMEANGYTRIREIKYQLDDGRYAFGVMFVVKQRPNVQKEIIKNYPGETPKDIVDQLNIAKKGSLMMLESYADMTKEIEEIKKNRKDLEESFKKKINHITNENDKLFNEKKDDKEKYIKKIYELKNKIEFNENKIKENDFLRNTLYYIYNIFFDKLNLVRDIVIDEKYKGLNKKDFNPNVLYDSELISYIELMLERMHCDSYDKMFRECIGYLNMIIRNYLPDKEKLRFKPVEILREITNFIDLKMKLIEEDQDVIKHNKININN
jgi:hypothetical protein